MEKTYEVKGMSCVICKNTVEKGLKKLKGVNDCKVNLLENEATIQYDENIVSEEMLSKTVSDLGYELIIKKTNSYNYLKNKLFISIFLVIILMFFSMGHMIGLPSINNSKYYQLILCSIIILLNINLYKSGYKALFHLNPNMNSLVSISSFVSYIYSIIVFNNPNYHLYFETSAMILVIVSIGKYIEGQNINKTTKTIRGLATLIPMQANLVDNNSIKIISIDDLKIDDIVEVKPGESIPQDGIVILGSSTVNESMITGESLPINKNINDNVIGGTVNIDGTIRVKITKRNTQTTISNIISLTKQATMNKIPIERLADIISKYFVFAIIIISIATFFIWLINTRNIESSLNYSLSVLVISCPCALGLATPSAIKVASGNGAKNGVLIKNPAILEIANKIKFIIFDKTGTLTKNSLEIIEIKQLNKEFINVLSSLELKSNHPIAKTIVNKYNNGNIVFDKYEQVSSLGVIAYLNNDIYYAGNETLANKYTSVDNSLLSQDYSTIFVGKNNKLLGVVYLADAIKEDSTIAINNILNRNITPIICSGDNEMATKKIANKLNIKEYLSSVTPENKNKLILEKKKQGIVAMVGDGINDAIAMSSADISFSVCNATDIAVATSDVILLNDDLNSITFIIDLSKKTMRIIKQNLFWALFYNAIFIPLAAGAFPIKLNPMIGAATMCISSIIVLTNALRINSVKKGGK